MPPRDCVQRILDDLKIEYVESDRIKAFDLVLLGSVAQTHDQITAHNVAHRIPHHPWIEALARDRLPREELPPAVRGVRVATNLMADGVRFPMHFDNFRHVTRPTVNTTEDAMEIAIIDATKAAVAPFGTLVSTQVAKDIDIPFYRGRVAEGGDIGFRYRGQAALRTAQIFPTDVADEVVWLERHLHLTQLFVDISGAPFVLVLAPPNHDVGADLPDLDRAVAVRFPPSSALLLHAGTWHDFPIAEDRPVTVLIGNSMEVVDALQRGGPPRELDEGDVWKVSLPHRFGTTIRPIIGGQGSAPLRPQVAGLR